MRDSRRGARRCGSGGESRGCCAGETPWCSRRSRNRISSALPCYGPSRSSTEHQLDLRTSMVPNLPVTQHTWLFFAAGFFLLGSAGSAASDEPIISRFASSTLTMLSMAVLNRLTGASCSGVPWFKVLGVNESEPGDLASHLIDGLLLRLTNVSIHSCGLNGASSSGGVP